MATAAEIRRWAIDQGLDVPGRGPLPPHLTDAYDAWHGTDNDIDDGQAAEAARWLRENEGDTAV